MTDIDEDERPTCPICGDETYGRPCETSYCAGHEAGRLAAIRAEVERALPDVAREARVLAGRAMARHAEVRAVKGLFSRWFYVGTWHLAERKRRSAVAFVAAARRWLQETA